jgi:cytochrome c-type biogenesis protein
VAGHSVGYLAAFGGGVVSFLSPCVLPLVPGYLSVVTGLQAEALEAPSRRQLAGIARDTAMFVAGFGTVFVLLGLSATSLGAALFRNHLLLTRLSGALVVAMAAFLAVSRVLSSPRLYREARLHPPVGRLGPLAAPLTGAAFGFGWTPCIGPVLASVLAVAATTGQAGRGAGLLAAYSAGLGLPFLACGLAMGRLTRALSAVRRHLGALTWAAAGVMAFFGVLLVLNRLGWLTAQLQGVLRSIGLGRLVTLG